MVSWPATRRLRTAHPRSWRRELLREDGDSETHKCTFQRRWRSICVTSWWTDKEMGNLWTSFCFAAFWGASKVLGLMWEEGSEQECPQPLEGWKPVNKNLFPSTLIVESCIFKAPRGQALVCTVTQWGRLFLYFKPPIYKYTFYINLIFLRTMTCFLALVLLVLFIVSVDFIFPSITSTPGLLCSYWPKFNSFWTLNLSPGTMKIYAP